MPRYSLMLARFPGNNSEHPGSSGWLMELILQLKGDPRFERIVPFRKSDTPITMSRNLCIRKAIEMSIDYVLMLDNDVIPDPCAPDGSWPLFFGAKPFFESSFQFLLGLKEPAAVAAPYCGPSPHNNVYVFKWATLNNAFREGELSRYELAQYSREEAAVQGGIQEVAALPTGLILYDVRAFLGMPRPFFYYEWTDEWQTEKASTEDVAQTRDMSLAWYASNGTNGGRVFCNWDAWAEHVKLEHVGKPTLLPASTVGSHFRKVVENRNPNIGEKVIYVKPERNPRYRGVAGNVADGKSTKTKTPKSPIDGNGGAVV